LRAAIEFAEQGAVVTAGGAAVATQKGAELREQPGAYAAIFEPDGRPLQEGDVLKQPALARTLATLAREGLDSFYRGRVAEALAADLAALGSPLGETDLAAHRAETPAALKVTVRGAAVFNTPPPTQGLSSLLILALFDRLKVDAGEGFDHIHGLVEATKQAFLLRDQHVGDPAYMTLDPQGLLDDAKVLDQLSRKIDPLHALPWPQSPSGGDTTWFGAIDAEGRVVSAIQSTYFEFGSGLALPNTGVVWQNRGASFQLAPQGPNALRPGRKPFHTLNPAIACFDDGRVMAYGAMGGEGQPQTQASIFTRYAWFGTSLQAAVTRPRWLLGRTWGEDSATLKLEDRFDPALYDRLRAAGHPVELVEPFTSMMGHAGALVRHAHGVLEGAADPRGDGVVAAW
jgi:gamma-glutamyltranspeptidase/glutathione hydrolase